MSVFRSAYLRVERDEEFHARLKAGGIRSSGLCREELDEWAWNNHRKQRILVEDVA